MTVIELQTQIEDEQRQRDEAREAAAAAERRANLIVGELEELRTALEQAERARKAAENELHDAADRISELSTQNANLSSQRRQLESTVAAMQADLDEAVAELKNSEERSKKAGRKIDALVREDDFDNRLQLRMPRVWPKNCVKNKNTPFKSNAFAKVSNNKSKIFKRVSTKPKRTR